MIIPAMVFTSTSVTISGVWHSRKVPCNYFGVVSLASQPRFTYTHTVDLALANKVLVNGTLANRRIYAK